MANIKKVLRGYICDEREKNWTKEYAKREIERHKNSSVMDHPDESVTTKKLAPGCVTKEKLEPQVSEKIEKNESNITRLEEGLQKEIKEMSLLKAEFVGKKTDKGEVFNNYKANSAKGYYAHAEGDATEAEGDASHAEGCLSKASGYVSHAEGYKSLATQGSAHAEGCECKATNESSHAEGMWTEASGYISHSEGIGTKATGDIQHVQGKYNKEDPTMAHIVGNGSSEDNRNNAHTLDWNGNAWFAGEVTVGEDKKKLVTEAALDRAMMYRGKVEGGYELPVEKVRVGDVYRIKNKSGFSKALIPEITQVTVTEGMYNMDNEYGIYLKFPYSGADELKKITDTLKITESVSAQTVEVSTVFYEVSKESFAIYITPDNPYHETIKWIFFGNQPEKLDGEETVTLSGEYYCTVTWDAQEVETEFEANDLVMFTGENADLQGWEIL